MHSPWACWEHEFLVCREWAFSDEEIFHEYTEPCVIMHSVCDPNGVILAESEWQLLEEFQKEFLKKPAVVGAATTRGVDEEEVVCGVYDLDWMLPAWAELLGPLSEETTGKSRAKQLYDQADPLPNMPDDAWMDLMAARERLLDDVPAEANFDFKLRGGDWTHSNKGVAYDSVYCQSRAHVRDWCDQYGLKKDSSFSTILYTDEGAVQMATFWCGRMQFLFELYEANGGEPGFSYTREMCDNWVQPEAMTQMFADPATVVRAINRLRQIQRLLPRM